MFFEWITSPQPTYSGTAPRCTTCDEYRVPARAALESGKMRCALLSARKMPCKSLLTAIFQHNPVHGRCWIDPWSTTRHCLCSCSVLHHKSGTLSHLSTTSKPFLLCGCLIIQRPQHPASLVESVKLSTLAPGIFLCYLRGANSSGYYQVYV